MILGAYVPEAMLGCVGLAALIVLPSVVARVLHRTGHVEPNFRGDQIPQSFGLVILLWTTAMLGTILLCTDPPPAQLLPWLIAVLGFGLLGLLDDLRGDKKIKGLKGHFRAALRERRITTGFVKAVGGGLLALLLAYLLFPRPVPNLCLAALLIALSANAINLFDLRPGRAGSVFLCGALFVLLAGWTMHTTAALPLLLIIVPTLPVYLRDRRAKAMMGDTGSNLLGACLGLAAANLPSLPLRLCLLALLIGLHIVAERLSLTKLIERQPFLRALDRLTGVR